MNLDALVDALADRLADRVAERIEALVREPEPELMTRNEAAKFLRCSLQQVDRLRRLHGLPWHRLGDVARFRRSELLEWLSKR